MRILDQILNLIFPKKKLLLAGEWGYVHKNNDASYTDDTIYYFSGDQPENSESNSNSNNDPNSKSDDEEMADYQPENSESNSNSDNDSDYESDDVKDEDVEEVDNHNAPEEVMNDLDKVDAARNNDPQALEYLKKEYSSFFEDNTEEEALDQIEDYLEEEFPGEYKKSEEEADRMSIEEKTKGQNSDDSNNDDNNSSGGGAGPLGPSGPSASDSGPSTSNSSGGNYSKIMVILGGILETISNVLENLMF